MAESNNPNSANAKLLATLFAERDVLSVSELNERVKELLEVEFFALQIQGEVSNYKRHTSGHWYFSLKDSQSQLRAVFFRQWNRLLRFEPENGLEVKVRGRLSVYEPRGEYQIVVETMEPVGVGSLQLAFEQQLKRLAAEGLFDESRKRPLPAYPRRIGIVTSAVGAALHDMLQILERRNRGIHIVIAPVRVQGNGAAGEIADAIRLLNKQAKQPDYPIDALIVGRGGGSAEDLWAFNEEQVVRAIYQSEIPVIAAVGHETDYTLTDFVADLRAPTPSAAAELVAAEATAVGARLNEARQRLQLAMTDHLLACRAEVRELTERPGFTRLAQTVLSLSTRRRELETRAVSALKQNLQQARWRFAETRHRLAATDFRAPLLAKAARLERLEERLVMAWSRRLARQQRQLAVNAGKLDMLSPLAVLGRGYTLVKETKTNKLVTHAAQLTTGQSINIRFTDGEKECEVKS